MADDRRPPLTDRRDNGGVYAAIEGLRSDVREDVGHLRDDMREDLERLESRLMTTLTDYIRVHSDDHTAMRRESESVHARLLDFVRSQELAQARRDGAIGVARYAIELFARHARPLALVMSSAAALLGVLSGAIRIEVIAR
jgi:predicted phage gp36 major capsid-like protein